MRKLRCSRKVFKILVIIFCVTLVSKLVMHRTEDASEKKYPALNSQQINDIVIEVEAVMAKRRALIAHVCNKYQLGSYKLKKDAIQVFDHPPLQKDDFFLVDRTHNLTYCQISKAASTTWRHQFLHLAGYSDSSIENGAAVQHTPNFYELELALRSTIKFLIVRHPFDRLVSAFRDKLENRASIQNDTELYYLNIVRRRIKEITGVSIEGDISFSEFIDYLINEIAGDMDQHWIPYYHLCAPCVINFDIIAHVESLFRDQVYLIKVANLEGKISPVWKHVTHGSPSNKKVAKGYFQQLTNVNIWKLYEKYQLDFELFGYDHKEYLDFGVENNG